MKAICSVLLSVLCIGLSACASKDKPCEEILEVKHQIQQCEQWRKIMINNNYPQQAMTAKKRYEQECQDLRYYRDDYDTICKGNETAIGENKAEH
jgi:type IV pilus biogenesis protein CpaD/CtpE